MLHLVGLSTHWNMTHDTYNVKPFFSIWNPKRLLLQRGYNIATKVDHSYLKDYLTWNIFLITFHHVRRMGAWKLSSSNYRTRTCFTDSQQPSCGTNDISWVGSWERSKVVRDQRVDTVLRATPERIGHFSGSDIKWDINIIHGQSYCGCQLKHELDIILRLISHLRNQPCW